ncbi:hypothetical protein [Flagellimonas meridianipacifica]|uniref:DUF3098 family protein n=1 Tax=Flagellimonas meridianipacifica TaxID=1080225 RepID=A0A2T0M832_9FLAO|nr:hypothetical protein [Allomuricauda pacifica]PRX53664.1 hypothetical protein CLV81_2051 [Allomuricauda pacifica]
MKLRKDQWIVLGLGMACVAIALYLRSTESGYSKFFPIFYAGTSMIWIAFINDRRSCRAKRKNTESKRK